MKDDHGPLGPLEALIRRRLVAAALWICLSLLLAGSSNAQEQSVPADTQAVNTLLQRVQELESEVKDLRSQVQALSAVHASEKQPAATGVTAPQPVASVPAAAPPPQVQPTNGMADGMQMPGPSNESIFHSPRLNLRGYGDVDWNASDLKGST